MNIQYYHLRNYKFLIFLRKMESFMNILNNSSPNVEPCGISDSSFKESGNLLFLMTSLIRFVKSKKQFSIKKAIF